MSCAVLPQNQPTPKKKLDNGESWTEHAFRFGPRHHCARCVFMRGKETIEEACTYGDGAGCRATYIEQICGVGQPWALRCKICHRAGEIGSKLGRGEARTLGETSLDVLLRHGNCRKAQSVVGRCQRRCVGHDAAVAKVLAAAVPQAEDGGASCSREERVDGPSFAHLAHAWGTLKDGDSFRKYTKSAVRARQTGAPI